jgi:hypothetical protein
MAFGVWLSLVTLRPLAHPVLYLHQTAPYASPKAISGRTSYLQVRLAFHPYPQVIQNFCNSYWFGPPRRVSFASTCPWIAHLVSCLMNATVRPVETRFRCACGCYSLRLATSINSVAHSPKGTPSHFRALTACRHTVSGSISLPSPGFFSPFPHGTCSLSVARSI